MYHFFIKPQNVTEKEIRITGSDVNHIRNVLRMKPDEKLLLSDGAGKDYHCAIRSVSESEVCCEILSEEASGTELPVRFFLFQGLPKSDKLEQIIQKSVELGVYQIIPVNTARSVVKYEEKKKKTKRERWQKIAESAAKQSRRGLIPEVLEPLSFREAILKAAGLDLVLIPYENYKDMEQTRQAMKKILPGMNVGIFIGPEGGFEQAEVEEALKIGAEQISLGSRILRTETAPLMLLSVLMFQLEK